MTRVVAMSAASALCLIWATGCASTSEPAPKAAASSASEKTTAVAPDANSEVAPLAKNLPATLDGEIRRAQLLRAKGDYDEAVHSLAQLMLFAPDDARVVGEYGKVLEQQGHSREALAFLKRAVELQPHDWTLHSALGVAYDQMDDHTNARVAYERALALNPHNGSVLNNYAVSRMLAGDYPTAQKLFAEAAAQGAPNPKLAGNLEKLAALKPEPAPAPAVVPANVAPATKPAPHLAASDSHARIAQSPKALGPRVVMQAVPVDPLAGPVRSAHGTSSKLAHAAPQKPKPVAPNPVLATPALRTAADAN